MTLFREIGQYLCRKLVIEHDVKEFAKEFSYAQSELSILIKDDINLQNIVTQIYKEASLRLFEIIPNVNHLVPNPSACPDLICLRCFTTRDDDYLVYGCQTWVKHKGIWRYYNYATDKWIKFSTFPPEDFKVTCCGCCGDVNTFYNFQVIRDYYFVY